MANDLIQQSRDLILQLTNEIERITPKAEAFDKFLNTDDCFSGSELAKMLSVKYSSEDKKTLGRNKFYEILRELGIMNKRSREASQYCINNKYAELKQKNTFGDNYETVTIWTARGIDYIYKTLIKRGLHVKRNTAN